MDDHIAKLDAVLWAVIGVAVWLLALVGALAAGVLSERRASDGDMIPVDDAVLLPWPDHVGGPGHNQALDPDKAPP